MLVNVAGLSGEMSLFELIGFISDIRSLGDIVGYVLNLTI